MAKILIAIAIPLLIIFFIACEKQYDNIIDSNNSEYQVTSIHGIQDILFNSQDSSVTFSILFNTNLGIKKVFADITDPSNNKIYQNSIELFDNGSILNRDDAKGDFRYSNYFYLSQSYQSGAYQIEYYVTHNDNTVKKVALQYFNYDNNVDNLPPVINNLSLTDSIQREVSFIFSIEAIDPNGLNDIQRVYFELYRPDGTLVIDSRTGSTKFQMFDDGNFQVYGDNVANDGVFSFKNLFGNTAQIGIWKFVFGAIDDGGMLSNVVEKEVQVL